MTDERRHKVLDSTLSGEAGERDGSRSPEGLDPARADGRSAPGSYSSCVRRPRTAGTDWFAMTAALRRVEDTVRAVWYASRVRDDARR